MQTFVFQLEKFLFFFSERRKQKCIFLLWSKMGTFNTFIAKALLLFQISNEYYNAPIYSAIE